MPQQDQGPELLAIRRDLRRIRHSIADARAIEDATPPWMPDKILYLKVRNVPSPNGYPYSYDMNVSGYYELTGGLNAFVNSIRSNPPNQAHLALNGVDGLDFTLEYSSYIVFQLDPLVNWRFVHNQDGIATDDPIPAEFVNLWEVRDNGDYIDNRGIIPLPNVPLPSPPMQCHIAYFAAKSPSYRGTLSPYEPDSFNLYVDYPKANGTPQVVVIDPEIKNTGHGIDVAGP
jgi:hypothetical protein